MFTTPRVRPGLRRFASFAMSSAVLLLPLICPAADAQTGRANVASHALSISSSTGTVDLGPLPVSQPLTVTLRLAPSAQQAAALDQLLTEQATPNSPQYHQWLTPQEYATQFGASDEQIATISSWAQSQGLTIVQISPAKNRMVVTGTTGQFQRAFAVTLHSYSISGGTHFASSTQPSVPLELAPLVASVTGLDNLPVAEPMSLAATSIAGQTRALAAASTDALTAIADAVDGNTTPLLSLTTSACSTDYAPSDIAAYRALFRQANSQGMTVLATSGCGTRGTGSFPGSLPEVTALTISPTSVPFIAIAPRPAWQAAVGLPADGNRYEPDLTTSSVADFARTMASILQQTGTRQGNINATLYRLATTPDLYTQPDAAPLGTWEATTGLGTVDLAVLAKVFPRATSPISTTTSLTSNTYAVTYGQPLTLTSKVLASSYGATNPSGTVTFVSTTQGTLGSSSIDSTGLAVLNLATPLNVGSYSITANYSGDASYSASSSAPPIIVTVSIANATITASISPTSNVPYGSTATVTATVTLPSSGGNPSGTVSAAVQGITAAVYTATLSPNPGGNSATANIVVAAPPPGSYQVQVSCAGNTNYLCQSPVPVTLATAKGNTLTTVTTVPVAPQAGQPVTITATITDNGNGPGPYSFTGNVTFYDNGKIIATAAVGSNQASASATLSGNVSHNIIASYSGDTFWNPSTSTPQVVNPTLLPSTLSLTSNYSTALAGVNIVFTATVYTTVANTVGPTGTVSFYDTFGTSIVQLGGPGNLVTLTPNGPNQSIARFTTTGLLAGTHSIYAIYNGDANFATSTSSPLSLNLTDYNVSMIPQTLTLNAGQTGQVVMLVGLVGGFTGTISFGCTPPASSEMTCGFSNPTLQGGGTTTMTITTTAPHNKTNHQASNRPLWGGAAGATLATLFCFVLPRRRRLVPVLLMSLFAVCLFPGLGCGLNNLGTLPTSGGSTTSTTPTAPTDPGSPLGTQVFTITTAGSDGVSTVRHTYQYQVTIQ